MQKTRGLRASSGKKPPHPPFGHLLPAGEKGNRDGAAYPFSPGGEGGGSRMRGPHPTIYEEKHQCQTSR
ncbi:hypothetical protein EFR00_11085 [Rhizobium sophoriradicis]|nr:hypothetical protein EFR00_11085 [Rhizobium sophoriradicis]